MTNPSDGGGELAAQVRPASRRTAYLGGQDVQHGSPTEQHAQHRQHAAQVQQLQARPGRLLDEGVVMIFAPFGGS